MKPFKSFIPEFIKALKRKCFLRIKQTIELMRYGPLEYFDATSMNNVQHTKLLSLYSAPQLTRIPNSSSGAELVHFFRPRSIYLIQNAVVLPSRGDVYVGEKFVEESSVWDHYSPDFMRPRPHGKFEILDVDFVTLLPDHGYFHFLIEDLPALLAVVSKAKNLVSSKKIHLIVSSRQNRYFSDVIKFLDIPLIQTDTQKWYRVKNLIMLSRGHDSGRAHPRDLQLIRNTFKQFLAKSSSRNIYISRMKSSRSPANEILLIQELKYLGFEIIESEKMTIFDQITLFSETQILIGVHGAGLANMVFMPENSKVIEVVDPNWANLCYEFLATTCNHQYNSVASIFRNGKIEIPIESLILIVTEEVSK